MTKYAGNVSWLALLADIRILYDMGCGLNMGRAHAQLSLLHEFTEPFILRELMDLHMLVEQGGKERTPGQWETLLRGARFRLGHIVECRGPMSVIEAEPI